jgi:hypothetical protein
MDTYQTALAIAIILVLAYIGGWVREFLKWRKAQQKTKAAEPVSFTAIDFTYSQEVLAKRIKKQAEELRELCGKGWKEDVSNTE